MPGLCSTRAEALATRDQLTANFRTYTVDSAGTFYLDPRLPEGAESAVLPLLGQAETEVNAQLGLRPPAPIVFVYFDHELMKAAACINQDVVAFYDGALHLIAGRADLQQSVTHEYTHHALFSSGLRGPAWAQEGIAMTLARETWWQTPARLQALLQTPFSTEQMESAIPYKLPAEQAVSFYEQAALTVHCLLRTR
ncbi:MAG TPA: translation initiation factor IF-2, partial [Polyangiaceae bacterium]